MNDEAGAEQGESAGSIQEALMQLVLEPVSYAPSDLRFSARQLALLWGWPDEEMARVELLGTLAEAN